MLLNTTDSPGVRVYDGRVPRDIYVKLLRVSQQVGWRYGWNTPSNPEARYWHHEIGYGNKQNTESVGEKVKEHPAPVFSDYQDWLLGQFPDGDIQVKDPRPANIVSNHTTQYRAKHWCNRRRYAP